MATATTQQTRKDREAKKTVAEVAAKTTGVKRAAKGVPAATGAVQPAVPLERWPDKKLMRIGEVAALLGVEPHVVRFWLQQFRSVRPERSDSNRLLFGRPAAERLLRIRTLLYEQGYTIAGARKALSEGAATLPSSMAADPPAHLPLPSQADQPLHVPQPDAAAAAEAQRAVSELMRTVERLEGELRSLAARLQAAQAAEAAARTQAEAVRARQAAEWRELADDLGDLAADVRG